MNATGLTLPVREEGPAPVTIFDASGRVVRIIPADEFRRTHGEIGRALADNRRRRGERHQATEIEPDAPETTSAS
jgi:hypothetical protein